ncbi:ribosome biogenesis GTPase YlqF [Oleiphilus sp. HI0009]|uniref:ribosome biogenesis GTPase YlqF n=1 Tax=unclassified Oleiphilus TaxID=2631174 RepID=UPI0007C20C17|nr:MULTISPECIES: ribosome biogenesis GTPase YlqF [unclassified Oleiphilus]KZX72553.1 ribosome biogenesis GTPase YlqF [Oleiphilus sp. HI0009]KZY65255.1 ribosome biogenesis GTPase YlqF [Oleiphilus sp. HI0066]KZY68353.1 ribosome biogenesis GTPase YlqF [Oleiphilus sp. HI0067]
MAINWFPGHMHKARKEIKKVMSDVDVVIELLDARIPFSSSNPLVGNLRGEKPVIKLLNKADLADPKVTEAWQAHLEKDNAVKSLALSATADGKIKMIANLCRKLAPHKVDSDKGISAMIMGIPNVGKSTLINSLAGKTIAKVGNEPAVTKRQQKIKLDNGITLSDTPGILWPKLEPATCGYRLASTGAVKDTAMEYEDVAWECLKEFRVLYPNALKDRYGLSEFGSDEYELLELIGKKRGCLKSGGMVDVHQAATIFLQDLRSGKLGRVTLETPEMMEAEMAEFRAMLEAKREQEELAKKEKEERSGKRTS